MLRRYLSNRINLRSNGKKSRGFTLVELIVVLGILAILAVAGVFTAVSYVRKAKFDKNSQNAITVYQAAQSALTKKTASGTMDSWVLAIPGFDENASDLVALHDKDTNFSRHKTIALTFNKQTADHDEDKYLYDLLSPYFYNPTVFNATISVELDICATKNNGVISYSVNVLTAFYSAENGLPSSYNGALADTSRSGGWDSICTNNGSTADGLPDRSDEYRAKKSYVGYYDGSSENATLGNISAVSIPWDPTYELQGHIIGPTEDNSQASGYLFNLRNGETLDVVWAIFDADRDMERDAETGYNYRYAARADHKESIHMTLTDAGSTSTKTHIYIDYDKQFSKVKYNNTVYRTYEEYDNYTIIRESVSGFIKADVQINNGARTEMTFPITKTLVKGDSRTGCPIDASEGYYEYSLTLDAMMSRGSGIDSATDYSLYYGVARLFGDKTPRNIFATLCADSSWEYLDSNGATKNKIGLLDTYAARSINDPVYLYSIDKDGDHMTYAYLVREHCAKLDGEDNDELYEDYIITGRAVVNTYFGDKVYGTNSAATDDSKYIGGTTWSDTSGEAVLTNCRHLYNIRWMSGGKYCYRIVSNINWYVHSGDMFASPVKVYPKNDGTTTFNSPVGSDGTLRTVSFPAINKLPSDSTLTSISDSDRRTYKINGIQLRTGSFINKTDKGYGLFCENFGNINNVYINDLSLIMASVNDGNACDYTGGRNNFSPDKSVSVGNNDGSFDNCPVGSLVGYNKGVIGSATETDESINTVQVTNTIVMSGNYWVTSKISDVGGIIGKNEGTNGGADSTYGLIKMGGRFLVIGIKNGGGIIGYNNSDIKARLVVDGEKNTDNEFAFPKISATGKVISCAVISANRAGGAIGHFDGGYKFGLDVDRYSVSKIDSTTGEPIFNKPAAGDFHIRVILPENSLVLQLTGTTDPSAGGAIGLLNNSSGDYLSIYTEVYGYIMSNCSGSPYCGGAIGKEIKCAIKDIYLECNNMEGSLIGINGTSTSAGAVSAGGAYGRIDTETANLGTSRTIAINVYNNGTISSRGTGNGFGTGGAIGGAAQLAVPVTVRVYNDENSKLYGYGNNVTSCNGTGGAVGAIGNEDKSKDNSVLVAASVVFAENHGLISGKHHVGGTFGNAPINRGSIYAVNSGTIEGSDFVGGVFGRSLREQSGTIQSYLSGAKITGQHFVGGAAGRLIYIQKDALVRTYVVDSSSVLGTGYLVGGVCGDILVNNTDVSGTIELKGSNTDPVLTVTGGTKNSNAIGTGGIAGIFRTQTANTIDVIYPSQTDLNRLAVQVDGSNDVGGVIGRLISNTSVSNTPTEFTGSSSATNFEIGLDVKLDPQSHVSGTGANVGGVIGSVLSTGGTFTGYIDLESVYGHSSGESYIRGKNNVGGAVGSLSKSIPTYKNDDSKIHIDFSSSAWTIEGTIASGNANVGGAVGYINAGKVTTAVSKYFDFNVRLGGTNIIAQGDNVGGAIGFNDYSSRGTELKVQLDKQGSISGHENVGGVIGKNSLPTDYGNINAVNSTINGEINATGNNVGGAIGYNLAIVNKVIVKINGTVMSTGDRVGGAIGYSDASSKSYLVKLVDSTVQGSGKVKGNNYVGGAVGMSVCNTEDMNATISGNAKIIGVEGVGGTLGFASAEKGKTGTEILKGNNYGRILRLKVTISADYALSGKTRMGGAVGQIGAKVDGSNYNSACLVNVEATLNSAYLFDPNNTGTDNNAADPNACIGGIVGIFVDGRLGVSSSNPTQAGGVALKGSGGVVKTEDYVDTKYFPARTYSNTVFIAANGSSIGGIVGQIGYDMMQQNVCLSNISAVDGPDLCVVSLNGKDRIGGWIGSGYAAHGGIGSNNASEFDSTPVTYKVDNVRAVISIGGSEIGGFCGRSDAYNNYQTTNQIYTFANIDVDLTDANIIGSSKVGGVFGETYCLNYLNGDKKETGSINVTLSNYTNIGDVAGNALPGDKNTYTPICYEAGGAIGAVESNYTSGKTRVNTFRIPITVTIDSTSRVCGLAAPEEDASKYGVGGAFGYCNGDFNSNDTFKVQSVKVISKDGSVPAVISGYTNAGGVVGILDRGNLKNASANVTVSSKAVSAGVGGIVGRTINSTSGSYVIMDNCHFGPDAVITAEGYFNGNDLFGQGAVYDPASYHVVSEGAAYVGGFAGALDSGITLTNCYTTATVYAPDADSAGGFTGKANKGTITTCYVGGHTYLKRYVSNSANVTGSSNVGGFVGQNTGAVTYTSCYSTASVYGSGSNVGGFAGSSAGNATITTCYSTGLVTCSDEETSGSFVGKTENTTYTDSCSLNGINMYKQLAGNVENIAGIYSRNAAQIRGTNNDTAHPFDSSLDDVYELRAVINSEHWGDWPIADTEGMNIALTTIVLDPREFEYRKSDYHLEDHLTITDNNGDEPVVLEYGRDYTLEYANANSIGTNAQVIISGIGNYYGAVSETFEITKASIANATVTISYPAGSESGFEYTGAPKVPDSVVTLGEDVLVEGIDYYLVYNPDNINISDPDHPIKVSVVGFGNYDGTLENAGTFMIVGRNLGAAEVTLLNATEEDLVYDGNAKTPLVTVRIDGRTLVYGTDYDINYLNNTDAGTATVRIVPAQGTDQYTGFKDATFEITQATNNINVEPAIAGWTWNNTPSDVDPELKAEFGTPEYSVYTNASCTDASKVLGPYSATDLTEAMRSLDAGNYYLLANIEETTNYTGVSKIVPFTVSRWNITGNVTVELQYTRTPYNESSQKPEVTVKYNGGEILDPSNYVVNYDNDTTSVGTKTITITGANNCLGSVTAQYEIAPVWTVTFYPDPGTLDGSGDPLTVTVTDGDSVARPTSDPIYSGYRFDGWYWYSNPSSFVPFNFGSKVTMDLEIYAKWTQWRYVTLVFNNGEPDQEVRVGNGERMDEPADPSREGYDFAGWYGDPGLSNKWNSFNAPIEQDYKLYAAWSPQTHTAAFQILEDTENTVDNQVLVYPAQLTRPVDPLREGYYLDGWYKDEDCTQLFEDFDKPLPKDITLYAKWKLQEYTIVFETNGGTEIQSQTLHYQDVITEPQFPSKEGGAVFGGWYTDEECTTAFENFDVAIIDFEKRVSKDPVVITLYAKWNDE